MSTIVAMVAAFIVAAIACARLARPDSRWFVADRPNERSMHTRITPRNGGLGVLLGLTAGLVVWFALGGRAAGPWLLAGVPPLAVLSAIDDRRSLPARVRLGVHLVVAGGVAAAILLSGGASWLWWPLWTLGLAWCINLYNFMDGLDGLAGGQAVMGFGGLAMAAVAVGAGVEAALPALIAAAAAGFLTRNWPPASIFLGDVGSTVFGLLAGALGLAGTVHGVWPFWAPLVLFAPFWLDATLTLLFRWRRGARLSEAHREHLYQRLALAGRPHPSVLLMYLGAVAWGIGAVALHVWAGLPAWPLVAGWALGLVAYTAVLTAGLRVRSSARGRR